MAREKYAPTRSFRADDKVWTMARKRAESEGRSMSNVLYLLLEGYARGMIDTPEVKLVYKR